MKDDFLDGGVVILVLSYVFHTSDHGIHGHLLTTRW